MLTTKQAQEILAANGIRITTEKITELARNGVFPQAFKNEGVWQIPYDNLSNYIKLRKGEKKKYIRNWIAAISIGSVISILGLLSITKDTLDLVTLYVLPSPTSTLVPTSTPTPTPTPTSTPTPLLCSVNVAWDKCLYVNEQPVPVFLTAQKDCLFYRTEVEIARSAQSFVNGYYKIAGYQYDGPVLITSIAKQSPAEIAGLRVFDRITQLDKVRVTKVKEVQDYTRENLGKSISFQIVRDAGSTTITLNIIPRSSPPANEGPIGFTMASNEKVTEDGYVAAIGLNCH